jgi:hypothetical protein
MTVTSVPSRTSRTPPVIKMLDLLSDADRQLKILHSIIQEIAGEKSLESLITKR